METRIKVYDRDQYGIPTLWLDEEEDGTLSLSDCNEAGIVSSEEEADALAADILAKWEMGKPQDLDVESCPSEDEQ